MNRFEFYRRWKGGYWILWVDVGWMPVDFKKDYNNLLNYHRDAIIGECWG